MAAVKQFPDTLRTDHYNDEHNRPILLGEGLELPWSPSSASECSETAVGAFARFSINSPMTQPSYPERDLQRWPESSGHCSIIDAPHAWQGGSPDWYQNDCPSDQLLYDLKHPHDSAAPGCWTPIDQETLCSGGGSWSPQTIDSRSEVSANYGQRHWGHPNGQGFVPIPFGGSGDFQSHGSYQRPTSTAVISPHDLQQYPDTFTDAPSPRADLHHVGAGQAYFSEDANYYLAHSSHDQYSQEDEGLGSSINDGSKAVSKSVSVKLEDDLEDEDDAEHDDDDEIDADWSPRLKNHNHGRRLSRRSTMTRNVPASKPKDAQPTRAPINTRGKPARIAKKSSKPSTVISAKNVLPCPDCSSAFPSDSTLKKHVLAIHTRPFICTFHRYGCDSTVGSKNEWKRHINVQHMRLETWRCDIGTCAPAPDDFPHGRSRLSPQMPTPSVSGLSQDAPFYAHEFDRKDLFTQHMKRMHAPPNNASRADKQAFENGIEDAQRRCHQDLRDAPSRTICPYCPDVTFDSWDDRIEHVGKHLEKEDVDASHEMEDIALRRWMQNQGFIQRTRNDEWKLVDTGKKKKRTPAITPDEDLEDAEGEDE
ncbi:hypothetical protein P7C71_g2279, partial [Lecanoromycetidae sp. Uapishka_2]